MAIKSLCQKAISAVIFGPNGISYTMNNEGSCLGFNPIKVRYVKLSKEEEEEEE